MAPHFLSTISLIDGPAEDEKDESSSLTRLQTFLNCCLARKSLGLSSMPAKTANDRRNVVAITPTIFPSVFVLEVYSLMAPFQNVN